MSVTQAECGSLFLVDSSNQELILDTFHNAESLNIQGLRQRRGEGVAGKVIDIQTPVLVQDINKDNRFSCNGFKHYHTNSFISVPLMSAKGPLGLINLADKSTGSSFTEQDLKYAVSIAKYACTCIDNFNTNVELQQEKEANEKKMEQLGKYASVGKLAAGLAHEINNPLDGITRYVNMLLNQLEESSVAREYLLEVKRGLQRIANIIRSLLEFSFRVNASASGARNYVDLSTLIDESLDMLRSHLRENIKIHKNFGVLSSILDLGLQHVILNMVKNAVDAMPGGGVLEVVTVAQQNGINIIFKDTGNGIPSEIAQQVFEPFFTTKSIDKGTGLGLAICKEIVHKYEGKIELESLPGKGTTFTVFIPQKFLKNA
jgi:K+-sensing histidine kinase KdpD